MNCTHRIKKNYMGDTCSTNEGEVHVGFCWGNPRERNNLEDLGMDGRIILNLNYYPLLLRAIVVALVMLK